MGIKQKGFTLIEMLLIVLLLGILSVFAMARLDISPFRTASFEQELRAAIRFAQKFAIVSGCDVQLRTSAMINGYSLFIRDDAGPAAASCLSAVAGFNTPLNNPATGSPFARTAPSGVNIGTTVTFNYDRQGRPSIPGTTIVIDGRNIVIENITGFVH